MVGRIPWQEAVPHRVQKLGSWTLSAQDFLVVETDSLHCQPDALALRNQRHTAEAELVQELPKRMTHFTRGRVAVDQLMQRGPGNSPAPFGRQVQQQGE